MDLIIETDIGHDPDDFFALSYLISAGVKIRAILVSPGDPDQIAIVKFLCKETGLDVPIGTSKEDRHKLSSGSIYHALLKQYKYPLEEKADGLGVDVLEDVIGNLPLSRQSSGIDLFAIGPVSSIGKYVIKHPEVRFNRATMQGGFLPYKFHRPKIINPKFEGLDWVPTFNLNGDRQAGVDFMNANFLERRMVGKNVCHTVLFTKEIFFSREILKNNRAAELFEQAAHLYFEKHDSKKFHDPTAACCHLYPEIGTWVRGRTVKMKSGWTTELDENGDYILADIDYDQLWKKLMSLT